MEQKYQDFLAFNFENATKKSMKDALKSIGIGSSGGTDELKSRIQRIRSKLILGDTNFDDFPKARNRPTKEEQKNKESKPKQNDSNEVSDDELQSMILNNEIVIEDEDMKDAFIELLKKQTVPFLKTLATNMKISKGGNKEALSTRIALTYVKINYEGVTDDEEVEEEEEKDTWDNKKEAYIFLNRLNDGDVEVDSDEDKKKVIDELKDRPKAYLRMIAKKMAIPVGGNREKLATRIVERYISGKYKLDLEDSDDEGDDDDVDDSNLLVKVVDDDEEEDESKYFLAGEDDGLDRRNVLNTKRQRKVNRKYFDEDFDVEEEEGDDVDVEEDEDDDDDDETEKVDKKYLEKVRNNRKDYEELLATQELEKEEERIMQEVENMRREELLSKRNDPNRKLSKREERELKDLLREIEDEAEFEIDEEELRKEFDEDRKAEKELEEEEELDELLETTDDTSELEGKLNTLREKFVLVKNNNEKLLAEVLELRKENAIMKEKLADGDNDENDEIDEEYLNDDTAIQIKSLYKENKKLYKKLQKVTQELDDMKYKGAMLFHTYVREKDPEPLNDAEEEIALKVLSSMEDIVDELEQDSNKRRRSLGNDEDDLIFKKLKASGKVTHSWLGNWWDKRKTAGEYTAGWLDDLLASKVRKGHVSKGFVQDWMDKIKKQGQVGSEWVSSWWTSMKNRF